MPFTDDELKTLKELMKAAIYDTLPTAAFTPKGETTPMSGEREFEVGRDEAWFANIKRTYDEMQDVSLTAARRSQDEYARISSVALQALQNAVETANMVAKQSIRQADVAADAQWNPVQQGAGDTLTARAVSIDDASLKAIGAILTAAVADALKPKA